MPLKILIPALLLLAACAHAPFAEPPGARAGHNDAPVISPLAGTPPGARIQEDPNDDNRER